MPARSDSLTSQLTADGDSPMNGNADPISENPIDYYSHDSRSPAAIDSYSGIKRPGFGVSNGEDKPRHENGPPKVTQARLELGYNEELGFRCPLVAGNSVILLSRQAYDDICEWLEFEDDDAVAPSDLIDNTDLFECYESVVRPGRMRKEIKQGRDFVFISPRNWEHLMDWFGGGPCITRKCVNDNGRLLVDIHGIELKLKRSTRMNKIVRRIFSIYDTVGSLRQAALEVWPDLAPDCRVWDYYDNSTTRMHPDSSQLKAFSLNEGQAIVFEEPNPDTHEFDWDPITGNANMTYSNLASSSTAFSPARSNTFKATYRWENTFLSQRQPVVRGAVGLSNLGNTCFMNSTLQCLSNIWRLREHFIKDRYELDINPKNPLGTGGKLARSFGDLMKLLWNNSGDIISPNGFKLIMAEFKPEFSGYQQHDSQELLSFLLDGLHEDLNRIITKPITSGVEANGRPDHEVAEDAARVHRQRNDSFVNDLFEGFFKSTVVCPDCNHVSVTFDPFTIVQLPVSKPNRSRKVSRKVHVLSQGTGLPLFAHPIDVLVPPDTNIHEIRTQACNSQDTNFSAKDFLIATTCRGRIDKLYVDSDKLPLTDELYAFQDPQARQYTLIKELSQTGKWYRPLITTTKVIPVTAYDNSLKRIVNDTNAPNSAAELAAPSCPFVEDGIWIGSLDDQRFRARLQICEVSSFGPWTNGLGFRVRALLDVSPIQYLSYSNSDDSKEEAAFDIWGFVTDSTTPLGQADTVQCKFEFGRYFGAFGSYSGDYPVFGENSNSFVLVGSCVNGDFLTGKMVENQSSSYYYSQPKSFFMMRVDKADQELAELNIAAYEQQKQPGPHLPLSDSVIAFVSLQQRKSFDPVGQPSVFSVSANTTSKQLYTIVIQRLSRQAIARGVTQIEPDSDDPFQMKKKFILIHRSPMSHTQRELDMDDDCTKIVDMDSALPVIQLVLEWDETNPLENNTWNALCGNLYTSNKTGNLSGTTLYDCFDMFSEKEKLTATETWYCSRCKSHKEAFKKMDIWDVPDVLVVHLKRFSQSQTSYTVDKDETEIDFPLEGLDLRDRVGKSQAKESAIYDLVAVSHHYGGLGGGHYVAHARNEENGMWYEFDDASVRLLGNSIQASKFVKGASAYVLFYVKREFTESRWGMNLAPQSESTESTTAYTSFASNPADTHVNGYA